MAEKNSVKITSKGNNICVFFTQNICKSHFFVVPLQRISQEVKYNIILYINLNLLTTMVFLYIYLALWVVTFTYAVYDSHKKVLSDPFIEPNRFLGIKIAEPILFLLLLSIITAPISIFVWLIDWIRKSKQKPQINLHIAKSLPDDIHTRLSIACANALNSGDWDEFKQYLTAQTTFLKVGVGETTDCIHSLHAIGKRVHTSNPENKSTNISVETCKFFAKTSVVINYPEPQYKTYILFRFKDDKLVQIVQTLVTACQGINYNPLEELPRTVDFLDNRCYDDAEPFKHRLPCFVCGAPSEELQWRKLSLKNTQYVIDGVTSICPHCHKQAEYLVQTQIEITKPLTDNGYDLPF